jgi:hypothetical protein
MGDTAKVLPTSPPYYLSGFRLRDPTTHKELFDEWHSAFVNGMVASAFAAQGPSPPPRWTRGELDELVYDGEQLAQVQRKRARIDVAARACSASDTVSTSRPVAPVGKVSIKQPRTAPAAVTGTLVSPPSAAVGPSAVSASPPVAALGVKRPVVQQDELSTMREAVAGALKAVGGMGIKVDPDDLLIAIRKAYAFDFAPRVAAACGALREVADGGGAPLRKLHFLLRDKQLEEVVQMMFTKTRN